MQDILAIILTNSDFFIIFPNTCVARGSMPVDPSDHPKYIFYNIVHLLVCIYIVYTKLCGLEVQVKLIIESHTAV